MTTQVIRSPSTNGPGTAGRPRASDGAGATGARHGASNPYKSLKAMQRAEIDQAWARLHSAVLREFPKPESGRIAVTVINHLGDEVMMMFRVE
jgi:hypothetical protein